MGLNKLPPHHSSSSNPTPATVLGALTKPQSSIILKCLNVFNKYNLEGSKMPIGPIERWQRRKKQKLFQQWVEKAELPQGEIPPELLNEHSETEAGVGAGDMPNEDARIYTTSVELDRGMVRLPFRYVIIGLSIIAFLLILSAVLVTILIIH
jgi:hypothetical protein